MSRLRRVFKNLTPALRNRPQRNNVIAQSNLAAADHSGGNPAVPAHRVVAAGSQILLHPRARVASSGPFEHDLANAKSLVLQRQHVDADTAKFRRTSPGSTVFCSNCPTTVRCSL